MWLNCKAASNSSSLNIQQVPFWCYQLTSKVAHTEYKRYASTPKKQWVKLNMSRSPKPLVTPAKQIHPPSVKPPTEKAQPTPRTRTRRAVKNMINGMTENYNAFQQNVAHQISTKILNPLSPKVKMIEWWTVPKNRTTNSTTTVRPLNRKDKHTQLDWKDKSSLKLATTPWYGSI